MKKLLKTALIAGFWLLVWALAAFAVGKDLLLPSPAAAGKALLSLAGQGSFWLSCGLTLLRVAGGFLLGMLTGTLLGFLTAFSRLADAFLSPLRSIIRATPVTSFIILVLLWLTTGAAPLFIAFLMVVPIAWANVREGLLSVDARLTQMTKCFGFSRKSRLWHLELPAILPQYLAAATTALGFAWKSGVTAEVLAAPAFSIGRSLYESKLYLETPALFAWTAVVVLLSMALEKLVVALLRRIRQW